MALNQSFLLLLLCGLVYPIPEPLDKNNIKQYVENSSRRTEHYDHSHVESPDVNQTSAIKSQKESEANVYENPSINFAEAEKYTLLSHIKASNTVRRIEDATVECLKSHMNVTLKFSTTFNGIVYPYEQFRKCILFVGKNSKRVTLTLYHGLCGRKKIVAGDPDLFPVLEHRLMIQWERDFVSEEDSSVLARCEAPDDFNKTVRWNFTPEELAAASLHLETNTHPGPHMSMEIQRGEGPNAIPLDDGPVFLGDVLTLVFTLYDDVFWFGSNVLSCEAIDGSNGEEDLIEVDNFSPARIYYPGRMTVIENECSIRPKIFSNVFKEKGTKDGYLRTIRYIYFKAFRFPQSQKVVLQCNIEVCFKNCDALPICSIGFRSKSRLNRGKRSTLKSRNGTIEEGDEVNNVVLHRTISVLNPEDGALREVPVTFVRTQQSTPTVSALDCVPTLKFYAWVAGLVFSLLFLCVLACICSRSRTPKKLYTTPDN